MVTPSDPSVVARAHALADLIRAEVLKRSGDSRDAARWLGARTHVPRSTWSRRFAHENLITYEDIVEAATALGVEPQVLVAMSDEGHVGGDQQDSSSTPSPVPDDIEATQLDLAAKREVIEIEPDAHQA